MNGLASLPREPALDRVGGVDALLHGHLGDAGEVVERHHVADREHLGMAGQRAVVRGRRFARRGRTSPRWPPRAVRASGDAWTPAAQIFVRASIAARRPVGRPHDRPRSASTPGDDGLGLDAHAEPSQLLCRLLGEPVAERRQDLLAAVDEQDRGARAGSIRRKLPLSPERDSSAIWPAISTPGRAAADDDEGEPRAARCRGRSSFSAISKAPKIRPRSSRASSIVFMPGAKRANSSWPKYDWPAPAATIRLSYS